MKDIFSSVSYDIDDVLDEWRSAMIIQSSNLEEPNNNQTASSSHTMRKVCSFIPSCCFRCCEIGLRYDIARKVKKINERLNKIAIRRKRYGLVHIEVAEQVPTRRITISSIDVNEVKDRGEEKLKMIQMLLEDTSSTVVPKIVSIVGMGGLGKTTLAQLVYNDSRVKEHFEIRMWVCVSDPFEEKKVARAILEYLGGSEKSELETMVQEIKERIGEKKFLLVLDDVWNKDPSKWRNIKATLISETMGSAIVITTRDEEVAKIMGCKDSNLYRPEHLSKQECWEIISGEAGLTEEKCNDLQDIGKQLAKKCNGLPLAAKALGGLLRFKETRQQWRSVLDSEMWQLGEEVVEFNRDLFAPLSLSYYDLSPTERQCLTYCVIYPKDKTLNIKELILLWMAQGYLKETASIDMEVNGEECFQNLSARSLFQDFEKDDSGEIYGFKMHDIVHDFLLFISKKECLHVEKEMNSLCETRHIHVDWLDEFPSTIFSFKKVRTLEVEGIEGVDLQILFKNLNCLRSLILDNCGIKEVPSTIGKLVHLRLLDLQGNEELSELPKEVSGLCNLQTLILNETQIDKPQCILEKINNLRYVYTDDYKMLTQGMGRLRALRRAMFLVDNVNGEAASLGNLRNMIHLRVVGIVLGRNMEHVDGAKQAKLNEKKHLVFFLIKFDEADESEEDGDKWKSHDEEVIEVLEPCTDLQGLAISGYLGSIHYPRWLMSLNHLTQLFLSGWKNCSFLPPLGKLQSLKYLELEDMKVRKVGVEFLGIDINNLQTSSSVVTFPKLEKLELCKFKEWEEWEMDYSDNINIMPLLTCLKVHSCYKLKALPDRLLQKTLLQELSIKYSGLLAQRYKKEGGVDWLKVSHIPDIDIEVHPA